MKPRPTDAEFDELKRKRDEGIRAIVKRVAEERNIDPSTIHFHASNAGDCYCACPDGPCQHIWDGPDYISDDKCMVSVTCSRCGEICAYHDLRCAP